MAGGPPVTRPEVTVVVPTHNRRTVLPLTLRSVLGQEGVSIHVVVVDDGSADSTTDWLHGIADPRITVVRHDEARGLPAARNAGADTVAKGLVAFCDDDDLWAPTKLADQLAALAADPVCRWATTGVVFVDHELNVLGHHRVVGGDVLQELVATNVIPSGSSVLVDVDLLRDVGGFDEALTSSEDWDCWIRVAQRSPLAVADGPLVGYRIWPGSMSSNVPRMRASYQQVVSRYAHVATANGVKPKVFDYERFLAKQHLRAGERLAAARAYFDLAVHHGHLDQLPRALAALVAPGLTDQLGSSRARRALPPSWAERAEAWIEPLRRADGLSLPDAVGTGP
ncbi:MAG: glycosyl transferase family [Actinomycetia bacterium]|nr:glycosyl transferase family [Actinomycetes bacterium]